MNALILKSILIALQSGIICAISDPRYQYDVPIVPDLNVVSLETVLDATISRIRYQKFAPAQEMMYEPLPFAVKEFRLYQPHHVTLDKTWVLTIPNGLAFSHAGYVVIDQKYVLRELFCHCGWLVHQLNTLNNDKAMLTNVRKISGRVAVITRLGAENYSHFMVDVLGRLAMLEMMGIEYDWLYIPHNKPHIKQILEAWGIDPLKIIEPFGEFICIEADELIVPTFPVYMKPTPNHPFRVNTDLLSVKVPTWLIEYYNQKFVTIAHKQGLTDGRFSKRVFISRQDSSTRALHNEEEVFKLFEACGFKKYVMTNLTFLEQIALFHGADIVVGAHGAALINLIFCKPGTKVLEIFQERCDAAYCYLSQSIGLDYIPVKTVEFNRHDIWGGNPTIAPLQIFGDLITALNL